MSYTIVWNENKTEGIILSGDHTRVNCKMATTGKSALGIHSTLSGEFYEIYGQYQNCTIQQVTEIK